MRIPQTDNFVEHISVLLLVFIAQTTALSFDDDDVMLPLLPIRGPLTLHFYEWLNKNGYSIYKFHRPDLGPAGSYGGKLDDSDYVSNSPVIFIHGNSDGALAIDGLYSTGFSRAISYFLNKGYKSSELYVTTWGDRNITNARFRTHSCEYLEYLRKFVDAVFEYTNAEKVNIISHSMGVTMARKVVKGGIIYNTHSTYEYCDLGEPIGHRINVFIGLAGANTGMCNCAGVDDTQFPTCNKITGFWPGDYCGENHLTCGVDPQPSPCNGPKYSLFLEDLNAAKGNPEAEFIASLWSKDDEVLLYGCNVYSCPTPLIPNSNLYHIYSALGHEQTKDYTVAHQYNLIKHRKM